MKFLTVAYVMELYSSERRHLRTNSERTHTLDKTCRHGTAAQWDSLVGLDEGYVRVICGTSIEVVTGLSGNEFES